MLLPLTVLHPFVDALSATAFVMAGGEGRWQYILLYNSIAFAMQFPMGLVLDRWAPSLRVCLGVICVLFAVCLPPLVLGFGEWAIVLVCLGNALFHVAAGKHVLEMSNGRSGPVGFFISTGAIGLTLGLKFGSLVSLAWMLIPLMVFVLLTIGVWMIPSARVLGRGRVGGVDMNNVKFLHVGRCCVTLLLLFGLVAARSWGVLTAAALAESVGGTVLFTVVGALVTWAGKAVGGYAADLFKSRVLVVGISAVGSLLLWFLGDPAAPSAWLVLVFVANLATGPVLSLLYCSCGNRGGSAFGINCLGLYVGGL